MVMVLALLMLAVELALQLRPPRRGTRVGRAAMAASGTAMGAHRRRRQRAGPRPAADTPATPLAGAGSRAGPPLVYLGIALLFACIVLRGLATARCAVGQHAEFINLTSFCGLVAGAIVSASATHRALWVFSPGSRGSSC